MSTHTLLSTKSPAFLASDQFRKIIRTQGTVVFFWHQKNIDTVATVSRIGLHIGVMVGGYMILKTATCQDITRTETV